MDGVWGIIIKQQSVTPNKEIEFLFYKNFRLILQEVWIVKYSVLIMKDTKPGLLIRA